MAKRVNLAETGDDWQNKDRQKAMKKGEASGRPDAQKVAAYRIGQDAIDALNAAAKQHNVQKGDLARFLILRGLELLEAGKISFEAVEPDRPKRIDI